jgi:hypothetical protein
LPTTAVRSLLALVIAAAALAGFGCGDDDENGQLSAADFRQRAEALCRTAEQRAIEIEPPGNPAQAAKYADGMHDVLVELRDGVGDLQPPDELREPYERYLDALDEDISTMEALGAAAEGGDQAQIQRIFNTEIDEQAGQLAVEELDLPSCGGAANAIAKTP